MPFVVRAAPRPLRWLAVPVAGTFTGVLLSQFHLVGVHAPVLAAVLIVVIAVVLCFAEVITPLPVPRGAAAGLTYIVVAGIAVWRWDSSRADLWFVAESGVILSLGVFLATRMREPRAWRRPSTVYRFLPQLRSSIPVARSPIAALVSLAEISTPPTHRGFGGAGLVVR